MSVPEGVILAVRRSRTTRANGVGSRYCLGGNTASSPDPGETTVVIRTTEEVKTR